MLCCSINIIDLMLPGVCFGLVFSFSIFRLYCFLCWRENGVLHCLSLFYSSSFWDGDRKTLRQTIKKTQKNLDTNSQPVHNTMTSTSKWSLITIWLLEQNFFSCSDESTSTTNKNQHYQTSSIQFSFPVSPTNENAPLLKQKHWSIRSWWLAILNVNQNLYDTCHTII